MEQEVKQNKIVVHALGGAGINVADKVITRVADLGSGFANIEFHYLDTSKANIDKIEPRGEFWHVKTKEFAKSDIQGSGAERRHNASDLIANINEYLDKNKFLKPKPDEFHLAVASASGGN